MKAWVAIALAGAFAAALAAGCGGLLIITEPPDGGQPCCDGGLPDSGSTPNGPPDRARTTLVVLPDTTVVADGITAVTLRVIVRDAAGHLLSGAGVAMSCDGTGNLFTPDTGAGYTGQDGIFEASLTSTRAEPKTLTVAVASFTLTATLDFIAGPPEPASSSLALAPQVVAADGVQTATVTATLRDAYGNIVTGNNVSFSATGANNIYDPSNQVVPSDATGVARMRVASTRAESKTVVATVGTLFAMTQPVTFTPGSVSPSTSSLTANPTQLEANGTARTTLTLLVRDPQGNPIPSVPATFSATGSGNTFSNPGSTAATNADGVARVELSSTVAEPKTVTAQVPGLTLQASVLFGPGNPTNGNSFITVDPTVVADGADFGSITVTIRDGSNNAVPDAGVSLNATGSQNAFTPSPPSGRTNAAGEFQARLSSTTAETKSVTATMATFSLTTSMDFLAGPADAPSSRLTASPSSVVADGAAECALSLVVRDANGNLVPGVPVTLSSTGSANTFSQATGTTDASGTFNATLRSTKAELKTVTAAAGSISLQASVSFVPGPPSAATSTVTASPDNVTANGVNHSTVTAVIRDALGNPVPGVQVSMGATGAGVTWYPWAPSGTTGSGGAWSALIYSTVAETKTVTATAGAIAPATTVTFVPGLPFGTSSSLDVVPSQVKADGVEYATVTYTVRDIYGNVIPNQAVRLDPFPTTGVTWSPSASGTTNASGVYTARISSTTAEQKSITATAGGYGQVTSQVTFYP